MIYVALLRGINVGGNNIVSMKLLKLMFEKTGAQDVSTYINSGNVIFRDESRQPEDLVTALEKAIEEEFGFAIKVLLRSLDDMENTLAKLPASWTNDTAMKSDVIFLRGAFDTPDIVDTLSIKPEIETVIYTPGALLWSTSRDNAKRSGILKIIGTDLYREMTVRNCNTARKLLAIMRLTNGDKI